MRKTCSVFALLLVCCVYFLDGTVVTGTGYLHIESDDTATVPLTLKGMDGQSGDYLQLTSSANANLFKVSSGGLATAAGTCAASSFDGDAMTGSGMTCAGTIGAGSTTGGRFQARVSTAAAIPLTVKHASGASVNYISIQDKNGGNLMKLDKNHLLTLADDLQATSASTSCDMSGGATITNTLDTSTMTGAKILITSATANTQPLIVKHAGTPSSNFITIQDSSGNYKFKITSAGNALATGSISASSFSGTFQWNSVVESSLPTTLSGYGIDDGMTSTQGSLADSAVNSFTWAQVNSRPNTFAGFGIDINSYMSSTSGAYANSNYQVAMSLRRSTWKSYFSSTYANANSNNYSVDCYPCNNTNNENNCAWNEGYYFFFKALHGCNNSN